MKTSKGEYQLLTTLSFCSYGAESYQDGKAKEKFPDIVHDTIGDFGRWQLKISLLMSLMKLPIAWFQLGIVFLAPPTEFWCAPPKELRNLPSEVWKAMSTPKNTSLLHQSALETGWCVMSNYGGNDSNSVLPCTWGYEYNRTVFNSSIITEWDLVCDKARLVDLSQVILMFGVLVGSIVFGLAADRSGRKNILVLCILLQSVFGLISAASPYFIVFLMSRFLMAIANGGTMIISFVMCMEVVSGTWRTVVPILYQIPFGIGNSIMACIAYEIREWRELQYIVSALSLLYLSYIWFVPESPRWLLAVGRKEEAVRILEEAAKTNGMDVKNVRIAADGLPESRVVRQKPRISELFRTPELRRRSCLLCLNWFICGISFYAFSQYLGQVSHNLFFAVSIGGLIAIPGTMLCVCVIKRFGRRHTISCAHLMTALCFLSLLTVPKGAYRHDWPRVVFASLGIVGMSVAMPALYLFTGELYPTVVRNAGVGSSVTCSKLGSMLAPVVIALSNIGVHVPLLVLASFSLIEAILVLPLPETLGQNLPETISDVEVSSQTDPEKLKTTQHGDYKRISTNNNNNEIK